MANPKNYLTMALQAMAAGKLEPVGDCLLTEGTKRCLFAHAVVLEAFSENLITDPNIELWGGDIHNIIKQLTRHFQANVEGLEGYIKWRYQLTPSQAEALFRKSLSYEGQAKVLGVELEKQLVRL